MARIKVEALTGRALCGHCSRPATRRLSTKVGRKTHATRACERHERLARVLLTQRAKESR